MKTDETEKLGTDGLLSVPRINQCIFYSLYLNTDAAQQWGYFL